MRYRLAMYTPDGCGGWARPGRRRVSGLVVGCCESEVRFRCRVKPLRKRISRLNSEAVLSTSFWRSSTYVDTRHGAAWGPANGSEFEEICKEFEQVHLQAFPKARSRAIGSISKPEGIFRGNYADKNHPQNGRRVSQPSSATTFNSL